MEKYYPYPCERCGACCKHVDLIDEMKSFDRGDGVCKHLTANNLCEIYSERPPLCNGEYVYKKFYSGTTVEEFHLVTRELCKKLRRRELEGFYKKISDAGRTEFAINKTKSACVARGGSLPEKI